MVIQIAGYKTDKSVPTNAREGGSQTNDESQC